ncbi:hypothetical protein HGQ98_15650 [Achromobacter ruhlandii]|uniref:Uncharacterized protein n=1 Tax=Achromobacter ruhlandii TaxID=72557 RepID=A0A848NJV7_9BURK|nr:hypothetical protein [Achromobacter ruhlandii]NMU91180.1 hypothetical protein [Achromobacter ruhlandii]
MPHPPTASRLLALTARQFTAQVPAMVAAAPWACVLFALSLPGALLLNQAGGPREAWFLLAAVVNLLALAPSLDGAQARVLARVFAAIVAIAALKSISGSLTLSLYFQMPNTPSTVFLAIALLLLMILWLPMTHLLGSWSLALPQAALTDGYGWRRSRQARRGAVWPFAAVLLLLTGLTEMTGAALRRTLVLWRADAIITAAGGLLLTLALLLFLSILCATAYRERA